MCSNLGGSLVNQGTGMRETDVDVHMEWQVFDSHLRRVVMSSEQIGK